MSTARARRLLEAPILPAILWLAAPGLALALVQTAVSIADAHFVGWLGTDARRPGRPTRSEEPRHRQDD